MSLLNNDFRGAIKARYVLNVKEENVVMNFPSVGNRLSQHNARANQITCAPRSQRIKVHTLSLMDESATNIEVLHGFIGFVIIK